MNNNSQKKYLIGSFIFLLFSVGIFGYLYVQIKNNNIASQEADIEWNSESAKLNDIKVLSASIKTVDSEKIVFESHFVKSTDVVSFLNTLENMARNVSVDVAISSVDELTDESGLVVGLNTEGTFEGLYKFLILLENSQYEIDVLSVSMERELGQDSKEVISVPKWAATFKIKLLSFMK